MGALAAQQHARLRQLAAAAALAGGLFTLGCAHAPDVTTTWKPLAPAAAPPVTPADVQVLSDAPDNIAALPDRIVADPGYPTPTEPDRVLGVLAIDGNADAATTLGAARAEAAKRGATVLVEAGRGRYLALWRSPAKSVQPSAPAVLETLEHEHAGLKPVGTATPLDLAKPGEVGVPLKRGQCYWLAIALDHDAACRSDDGDRIHCVGWSYANEWMGTMLRIPAEAQVLGEPAPKEPLWTRGFLVPLGCATRDGVTMPVQLIARQKAHGSALVQPLTGDVSEQAIARWQAEYEERVAEAAAREAERKRRMEPVCAICAPYARRCDPRSLNGYTIDACSALDECVREHLPPGVSGYGSDCLGER